MPYTPNVNSARFEKPCLEGKNKENHSKCKENKSEYMFTVKSLVHTQDNIFEGKIGLIHFSV